MPEPLEILLFVVASAALPGFYLLLCGVWSIWLALGRTAFAIRVPVFLLGTLPLGLAACMIESRSDEAGYYLAYLVMAVLSAAVFERKYFVITGICCVAGSVVFIDAFRQGGLKLEWFTTITLAICFLAGLISLIRLLGFRLICFSSDAISQEIQPATGRDMDEWIAVLDKAGASSWNYAEIVIFLRDYGFSYRWQKAITVAYEKSLGRRSVDSTFDGKSQQIQATMGFYPPAWFSQLRQQRFTTWHMLLWSVAAACFFGFFRLVGRFELTTDDVAIGAPVIMTMALVSFAALQGCLGVRYRSPRIVVILLVVAPSFAFPFVVGLFPGVTPIYVLMVSGMLGYAIWLTAALLLVRQRGYRLVRVQTAPQQALAPSV